MNLMRTFMRWFAPRVCYLGNPPLVLDPDGRINEECCAQESCRLLILGKHAYFETVQTLPISDLREIKAAVAMDPTAYAPFATDMFFLRRIERQQERSLVNLWFVRPEAIEAYLLDSAWMVIPETALWSMQAKQRPRLDIIGPEPCPLLVHVGSTGSVRSTIADNAETSLKSFQRGLGPEGANCPVERIASRTNYLQQLLTGLANTSAGDLVPFIQWRFIDLRKLNTPWLRRALVGLAATMLVYLTLWAMLPLWVERQLSAENEQLNAQLGSVLDRQTQIDALRQEIGMLASPMAAYAPKLTLFHVVHETLAGRAVITRMSVAANRVELRGTAEQASVVLTALAAVPGIDNVQLTAPLTKDRRSGQDLFAISFMMTSEFYRHRSQDVET